ncbi:MAG: hypothetical protein FWC68_04975, partial [Oscillospiraceae bacterium]|nr:hypothetical protein [Oscillospiraceae bacterium]
NFNMVDGKKNSQMGGQSEKDNKDYILNEAQMVISNYIGSVERYKDVKSKSMKKAEKSQRVLRTLLVVLGVIMLGIILS